MEGERRPEEKMSSDMITIKAQKREVTGKKVKALRRTGILPGVIYGSKTEPISIQMDAHSTSLIMGKLTGTSIVNLDLDGKKHTAIVRDRQRDVIYEELMHVDFLEISLKEKLRAMVAIELVGEAPVLKQGDAIINQGVNELDIEALPMDLPERIEVDLSGIETAEDTITVADLKLGDDVTIHTDPEEVIVSVVFAAAEPVEGEEAEEGSAEPEVLTAREDEEEEA